MEQVLDLLPHPAKKQTSSGDVPPSADQSAHKLIHSVRNVHIKKSSVCELGEASSHVNFKYTCKLTFFCGESIFSKKAFSKYIIPQHRGSIH